MPEGRGAERGSNWGFEEIRMLLEVRAEEAVCDMVTGTSRDTQVYEQIQSRLATMGVVRSRRQITSKLKTLKSKFFKVKDKNRKSGGTRNVIPHYDLCETIWGQRAAANPVNIVTSAQQEGPPLDGVVGDQNQAGNSNEETGGGDTDTVQEDNNFGDDDFADHPADHLEDDELVLEPEREAEQDNLPTDDGDVPEEAEPERPQPVPLAEREANRPRNDEPGQKKKRAKKTKLQASVEAVSRPLLEHLDTASKAFREDEERIAVRQLKRDKKLQKRHERSLNRLVEKMNEGQLDAVTKFGGMLQQLAGPQFLQGQQPHHDLQAPGQRFPAPVRQDLPSAIPQRQFNRTAPSTFPFPHPVRQDVPSATPHQHSFTPNVPIMQSFSQPSATPHRPFNRTAPSSYTFPQPEHQDLPSQPPRRLFNEIHPMHKLSEEVADALPSGRQHPFIQVQQTTGAAPAVKPRHVKSPETKDLSDSAGDEVCNTDL